MSRPKKPAKPLKPPKDARLKAQHAGDVLSVPFNWRIPEWPWWVAPGSPQAARNLVRDHKRELLSAGVLSRSGRDLVFWGGPYIDYLRRPAALKAVLSYQIAPNREAS